MKTLGLLTKEFSLEVSGKTIKLKPWDIECLEWVATSFETPESKNGLTNFAELITKPDPYTFSLVFYHVIKNKELWKDFMAFREWWLSLDIKSYNLIVTKIGDIMKDAQPEEQESVKKKRIVMIFLILLVVCILCLAGTFGFL